MSEIVNSKSHKDTELDAERKEDTIKFYEEAFRDYIPAPFRQFSGLDPVGLEHSGDLLQKARSALRHNDIQKATHLLTRDIAFCKSLPSMALSPELKSAEAGLKAIQAHKSAGVIDHLIQETWLNACDEDPDFFNCY